MKIKLVGALPRELKDLGVKSGQTYDAFPAQKTNTRAVQFYIWRNEEQCICTVWPENFTILK